MTEDIPPPLPQKTTPEDWGAIDGPIGLMSTLESALKRPGKVLYEVYHSRTVALTLSMLVISIVSLGIYGVVVGSLSGGSQLWIAPAKIVGGTLLSIVICLPSLYIFLCLSGVDIGLRQVVGLISVATGLSALLLIGFCPVAWIFSQSTDSIALMAVLHLAFWSVGLLAGLRLLVRGANLNRIGKKGNIVIWIVIYILVSLQMMTTIRPIVGTASTFLPEQKEFFLTHWANVLNPGVR